MPGFDDGVTLEVGDRPGDGEHAVVAPSAQPEPFRRAPEHGRGPFDWTSCLDDLLPAKISVEQPAGSIGLPAARRQDPGEHRG